LKTGFVHVDHHKEYDQPKSAVQAHSSLESRTSLQAHTSLDKASHCFYSYFSLESAYGLSLSKSSKPIDRLRASGLVDQLDSKPL
jgi:hypothetical protein